ncbi:MAG TPA: Calx-beta domain-containing protein [Thermoanaerobaculia bacterium]|nr:Calx-beta domain-containing protein [Thermoanaerobaculia bacterium]
MHNQRDRSGRLLRFGLLATSLALALAPSARPAGPDLTATSGLQRAAGEPGLPGANPVQTASSPGSIGFEITNYMSSEAATRALIVVLRSGGTSGMVSVHYATSDGTAVAGINYTPASGTLSWADGDSTPQAFSVPMIDDGVQDGTHTVNLALSSPTGGATLGQSTATLAIADADQPSSPAGHIEFGDLPAVVSENDGSRRIHVLRDGGSAGAVTVHYATSDGTGVAGVNYSATSGTISWADGESSSKAFFVAVLDDGVADGDHTVNLTLSNPTGGAVLGLPSTGILTILNSDGGASAPAAPSNLVAAGSSTSSIHLTWKRNSTDESLFHILFKVLDGSPFQNGVPLLPAGTTETTVTGLQAATGYGFRVQAESDRGGSAFSAEADAATDATDTPPISCAADANTLCLGGRFKTSVAWKTASGSGVGTTVPLAGIPDSGLFYFFGPSNIEMLIKVINGCPVSNAYWVFFAATTNVQFTVTVIDTMSGKTRVYFNSLDQAAAPVQDTNAFATCP